MEEKTGGRITAHLIKVANVISYLWKSARAAWVRTRLRAAGRIFQNLPFVEIENRYAGRAANFQLEGWKTVLNERGGLYRCYESSGGHAGSKVNFELERKVFFAPGAYLFSAKGIVYNIYYRCAVLETVEEWGIDVNLSTEFMRITSRPTRALSGLTFSLASIGAVYNYAHFLFDGIARLALLEKLNCNPDHILVSGPRKPWKEKTLRHLGVSSKVEWINEDEEIRCEQLLFTNRLTYSRHVSPFAIDAIRRLFNLSDAGETVVPHRVIFASRRNAKDRRHRYEDMLQNVLPSFVEFVDFETLSMEDTIRICRECKLFFGFHGAAFSNVIFCQPGVIVIELQIAEILPDWHRDYYRTMYDHLCMQHEIVLMSDGMDEAGLARQMDGLFSRSTGLVKS